MCGLGNGIEETLVSIWGEVHGNFCARGDGSGHFNIKVDFPICAIRIACWSILPAIDGHTYHRWQRNAQLLKVGLEITGCVAPTKFDERDTLTTPIRRSGREVVELG